MHEERNPMTTLREAAQLALEALERLDEWLKICSGGTGLMPDELNTITALRAALAQQDGPVEPVAWLAPDGSVRETTAAKSFGEWVWGPDDFKPLYTAPPHRKPLTKEEEPVLVQGELPPRYVARSPIQAEPLNLTDPAVQKRLAAQWGYVPAAQAEPVQEPVAWNWMLDGLPYGRACYGDPPDADLAERAATAGRTVRLLYAAPPQRRPLTEEEKRALADKFLSCQPESYEVSGVFDLISAVERAHGIKE